MDRGGRSGSVPDRLRAPGAHVSSQAGEFATRVHRDRSWSRDPGFDRPSGRGQALAGAAVAVVCGPDAERLAATLDRYGADEVWFCDMDALDPSLRVHTSMSSLIC